MNDSLKAQGWFHICLKDTKGRIKEGRVVHNLITSAGKAGLASRINGSGGEAAFTYMALGTDNTAASVANTALGAEIIDTGLQRVSATPSRVTTNVTNDTAQLLNAFTATGVKTITECGLLNAAMAGTLLCRQVFTGIVTANNDVITFTYKVVSS